MGVDEVIVGGAEHPAVFLDRDGVLNPHALNPATGEWESPHTADDFELYPGTVEALLRLRAAGYMLFVVSNQPSYAKGKTTLDKLAAIHAKFVRQLGDAAGGFREFFYCYHHPTSTVPGYGRCECRKPSPFFLLQARDRYGVDLSRSYMVGDRDLDIECGRAAGTRTVWIRDRHTGKKLGSTLGATFECDSLGEAVEYLTAAMKAPSTF